MNTDDVVAQQVALYGEPLSVRFGRLLQAYGIPQSRLAAAIGLSAPMLSQLATGQRVKISNPAVLARLLRLEQLAGSPAVRSGDPARIAAALDEVAASRPQLTTEVADDGGRAVAHLAAVATPDELAAAAAAVPGSRLAALLDAAASHRRT
ncbi:hypothetical protein [Jatrophihabitans fulvus]